MYLGLGSMEMVSYIYIYFRSFPYAFLLLFRCCICLCHACERCATANRKNWVVCDRVLLARIQVCELPSFHTTPSTICTHTNERRTEANTKRNEREKKFVAGFFAIHSSLCCYTAVIIHTHTIVSARRIRNYLGKKSLSFSD